MRNTYLLTSIDLAPYGSIPSTRWRYLMCLFTSSCSPSSTAEFSSTVSICEHNTTMLFILTLQRPLGWWVLVKSERRLSGLSTGVPSTHLTQGQRGWEPLRSHDTHLITLHTQQLQRTRIDPYLNCFPTSAQHLCCACAINEGVATCVT